MRSANNRMKQQAIGVVMMLVAWQGTSAEELPPRIAQWQPNVCRVRADAGSSSSLGSGVYLGRGLVLTAYHVIEDVHQGGARCSITLHGGGTYQAKVAGWNIQADVGFLKIDKPREVRAAGVLLATADPAVGDVVWRAGYGGDGRLIWHRGTVRGYSRPSGGSQATWFTFTPWSRSGSSGGPIFNDRGELIGDLWGSNTGDNTSTGVLASSLGLALGNTKESLQQYHVQCYGPGCYSGQGGPFYWLFPGRRQPQQPGGTRPPPSVPGAPGGIPAPSIEPELPGELPGLVELAELKEQVAALNLALAELKKQPAVAPGVTAEDVERILEAGLANIQPGASANQVAGLVNDALGQVQIPVQVRNKAGQVLDSRTYKLGEPIKLDFDTRLLRGTQPGNN